MKKTFEAPQLIVVLFEGTLATDGDILIASQQGLDDPLSGGDDE